MAEHDESGYALVLAFDTDDPEFTRGFEAGAMWEHLDLFTGTVSRQVHSANAEMVMRMAEATGRTFRAEDCGDPDWVIVHLGAATDA